jgi:hypothetical protein
MRAIRSGRRYVLAALGMAGEGARMGAVAPSSIDAELIALCSIAAALSTDYEARLDALLDVPGNDPSFTVRHAAAESVGKKARDMQRLVLGRRAHTLSGMRSKAEVIRPLIDVECGDPVELFAWSLARDLSAMERRT